MAEKNTAMTQGRQDRQPARGTAPASGPFTMLQRFADEVDRMFDEFGFGRRRRPMGLWGRGEGGMWAPDVDVVQRQDQLIIKADLPGLRKEDISVDVTEDAVTIQGERKSEREEERDGVYRSERSYGSFCRVIPLPSGAIADQAKASFRDGVLEISMPAPPPSARARRIEIGDTSTR